jgi:hypothetical protein
VLLKAEKSKLDAETSSDLMIEKERQVSSFQHDMTVWFWSFCHPEPGPELDSGSTISGSQFLV